jgi:hypothetical protein
MSSSPTYGERHLALGSDSEPGKRLTSSGVMPEAEGVDILFEISRLL